MGHRPCWSSAVGRTLARALLLVINDGVFWRVDVAPENTAISGFAPRFVITPRSFVGASMRATIPVALNLAKQYNQRPPRAPRRLVSSPLSPMY